MENKQQSKQVATVDLNKSVENLTKAKFASKAILEFNDILDKQPKEAVKLLSEQLKGSTVADTISAMQQQTATGRAAWVSTALMVARAYEGNEDGEKREKFLKQFEEKLGYKRSSIDGYIKIGRKLIEGNFDKIPKTRDEFMKPAKKDKEMRVFEQCEIINCIPVVVGEGENQEAYTRVIMCGNLTVKDNNVPTETEQLILATVANDISFDYDGVYQLTESKIRTVNKGKETEHIAYTITGVTNEGDITPVSVRSIQAMRIKA